MKIFRTIKEMNEWARQRKNENKTVGLVPTMGFLHEGHLSLIKKANENADAVVVSIFVNPTQFGPTEDYACYPRKEEEDCKLCEATGADAVFMPTPKEMYPSEQTAWVDETKLSKNYCGASRPIHFRGVCSVVTKLFNIVMPDVAVFGQKDFQQFAVLKRMVNDLNFPIKLIRAPIVREADGLAKSSRNTYLTKDARQSALSISRSLFAAKLAVENGEKSTKKLEADVRIKIENAGWNVEYATVIDAETLEPIDEIRENSAIIVAAKQNKIRLIDNILL